MAALSRPRALVALAWLAAATASCRRAPAPPPPEATPTAPTATTATPAAPQPAAPRTRTSFELASELARCEVFRSGSVVDLGGPALDGRTGPYSLTHEPLGNVVERDGATWLRVRTRQLAVRFTQLGAGPVALALRGVRGAAHHVAFSIDGRNAGTLVPPRGPARTVTSRATSFDVAPGAHVLGLRFVGGARATTEPLAELDALRIGPADTEPEQLLGPTLAQLTAQVALSGEPHRAVTLHAPSRVRCTTWVAPGARLRAHLGLSGPGEGDLELTVLADGMAPVSLHSAHVTGGDHARYTPVDLPLDRWADRIVAIELAATATSPSGLALFGDPAVVTPEAPPQPAPRARLVVVLVTSASDAAHLPPRMPDAAMPVLAQLRRESVVFEQHRAPTTVSAAVVASLLTGVAPRVHGLDDAGARLPAAVPTLATIAHDGSVQGAFFTGNPHTFEPFGFARAWDRFASFSPVDGAPAVAPLREAARFVAEHLTDRAARALVVVHARGGHPPWDVAPRDAEAMPPADYLGPIDPRRAAQVLARARGKRAPLRLGEGDRVRIAALHDAAALGHDGAVGELIEAIRRAGAWDETLFVVTSDAATSSARVPFGEGDDLSEDVLATPLWLRLPRGAAAGTVVAAPTTTVDVTATALAALGLAPPRDLEGTDLAPAALGAPLAPRALLATLGSRYATRWGSQVLSGESGRVPALCDLARDAACATDAGRVAPFTVEALFGATWRADAAAHAKRRGPREPAAIDDATAAALAAWGG